MSDRREALFAWLGNFTGTPVTKPSALADSKLFREVLCQIPSVHFSKAQRQQGITGDYLRMRETYDQVLAVLKENNKWSFPQGISTVNLLLMAKGSDEEGLQTLIQLILLACVNCKDFDRQKLMSSIMGLSPADQQQLKKIIEEGQKGFIGESQSEQTRIERKNYELCFRIESLEVENQSLREHLISMVENDRRQQHAMSKIIAERDDLQRELVDRMDMMRQREDTITGKQFDSNQEVVEQLKKTLLEREVAYSNKIHDFEEQIYALNDSKEKLKRKVKEFEEQSKFDHVKDHANCVNVQVHKRIIADYAAKSKEASQNDLMEFKYKLENVKLVNELNELKSKCDKLRESKPEEVSITMESARSLEVKFFSAIRDSLRAKIDENAQTKTKIEHVEERFEDFLDVK